MEEYHEIFTMEYKKGCYGYDRSLGYTDNNMQRKNFISCQKEYFNVKRPLKRSQ